MRAMVVPDHWERVTDPELCWMAMVDANEGKPFLGMRSWENGGVDLFGFDINRHSFIAQKSLAGYVQGQRFVVVWCPQEPTRAPEVYYADRRPKHDEDENDK